MQLDTDSFEVLMKKRYFNKLCNEYGRLDRSGHLIIVKMTEQEYIDIFLPFKNDQRLYLPGNHPDRLCLCRNNDLGDYEIGNVYVDTMRNNQKFGGELTKRFMDIEKQRIYGSLGYETQIIRNGNNPFAGRKHKPEFFDRQSRSFKDIEHQQGEKNSQFGTCWIYNIQERLNKKIPVIDLPDWEAKGWIKGRKMKF